MSLRVFDDPLCTDFENTQHEYDNLLCKLLAQDSMATRADSVISHGVPQARTMISFRLRPLDDYMSLQHCPGEVTLYALPSTESSKSHFRMELGYYMFPEVGIVASMLMVQHTHLSGHEHENDQLVLIKHIGANDEAIMGILTRCWHCVDLWHVLDYEKLQKAVACISSWEEEPKDSIERMKATSTVGKSMVHGCDIDGKDAAEHKSVRDSASDESSESDVTDDEFPMGDMKAGPIWIEKIRCGERSLWWYKQIEKVKKLEKDCLRVRGTAMPDEKV